MNKETDIVVHMKPKKVVKYRIVKDGKNPTYYKHDKYAVVQLTKRILLEVE